PAFPTKTIAPSSKISSLETAINLPTSQLCINKNCFTVRLASSDSDRQKGLMFQKSLPENAGMLFVFEQSGIYPFWMKNTLIPLDMLRIDSSQKIVHIASAVQPCLSDPCAVIDPATGAQFVLELSSGVTQKFGIKIGDTIQLRK
ncbi:MAG TPA: DUF192 domain-containing protein, partial [Candidatus Absconditabacterales bacterium]|nr:DUF192 domain-containing protein [Candidatus Absconditabacterales bacterium]